MRRFTEHLESVNETYLEHLLHATQFSCKLLLGAFACLLHALFPFLFINTGSKLIEDLHRDMVTRRKARC